MLENAKHKQITSAKNKGGADVTARNSFIIEKSKKGFTPTEILTLLKREGFATVARSRIYQILDEAGLKH